MEMQERLEKLEKERWVYLGLGSLAVIAGLLGAVLGAGLLGGGGGDTLRAQTLVLRSSGEAIIVQDASGKQRIAVGLNDKGLPAVHFFDTENKRRQVIGLSASANPQVLLLDKEGKPSAEFHLNEEGMPRLSFMDALQTKRQQMGLDTGGEATIEFYGLNNDQQAKITGDKLQFFDRNGKVVAGGLVPLPPAPARPVVPANKPKPK
jgi:hypothetical protein